MPFLELPVEIHRKILDYLYEPWHLYLEELPARSRYPLYQVMASRKLQTSPLRTCHLLRDLALALLQHYFVATLDARSTVRYHSLMPKYKTFLHCVKVIQFPSVHVFTKSGELYHTRLADLTTFEIHQKMQVTPNGILGIRLYEAEELRWFAEEIYEDHEYEQKYRKRLEISMVEVHDWQWALRSSSTLRWHEEIDFIGTKRVVISFTLPLTWPMKVDGLTDFKVTRHSSNSGLPGNLSALTGASNMFSECGVEFASTGTTPFTFVWLKNAEAVISEKTMSEEDTVIRRPRQPQHFSGCTSTPLFCAQFEAKGLGLKHTRDARGCHYLPAKRFILRMCTPRFFRHNFDEPYCRHVACSIAQPKGRPPPHVILACVQIRVRRGQWHLNLGRKNSARVVLQDRNTASSAVQE